MYMHMYTLLNRLTGVLHIHVLDDVLACMWKWKSLSGWYYIVYSKGTPHPESAQLLVSVITCMCIYTHMY